MSRSHPGFGPHIHEGDAGSAHDGEVRLQLSDVGKLVRRTQRRIVGAAREADRVTFAKLIREHLGTDRSSIDVVEETWPSYDHVNVQVGLDAWLERAGREHTLVGVANFRHREFDLSDLMRSWEPAHYGGLTPGNVARLNLPVGPSGEVRACVVCAVYLVSEGDRRAVLLLRIGHSDMGESATRLEIATDDRDFAASMAADIRESALKHNIYRGQVVSFGSDMFGERHTVLLLPPPSDDDAGRPGPARRDDRRDHPSGGGGRSSSRPAAGRRPAPQAGPASVRSPRRRQDPHGPLPDEPAHGDHDRAARRRPPASDRCRLLGRAHPAARHDRGRGRRPDRGGPRQYKGQTRCCSRC